MWVYDIIEVVKFEPSFMICVMLVWIYIHNVSVWYYRSCKVWTQFYDLCHASLKYIHNVSVYL